MQEGYIKLHRCILDSSWSRHSDFVAVWVYCLLRANYCQADVVTKGGGVIHLEPGQFITSREQISGWTGVQESKVERILKVFKSEQQIEQQNCGKFRVISIINWSKYQSNEQQIEQQMNSKRTTNEQQMNTNKKVKKKQEGKEGKEGKGKKTKELLPICKAWHGFKAMRKSMRKPMTDRAEEIIIGKLIDLQAKGYDPVEVLNLAIEKSWLSVYDSKELQHGTGGTNRSTATIGGKTGAVGNQCLNAASDIKPDGYFAGDFPDRSDQW